MKTRSLFVLLIPLCGGAVFAQPLFDVADIGNLNLVTNEMCEPASINASGKVCGTCFGSQGGSKLFVWTAGGGILHVPGPSGSQNDVAQAINSAGVIAGRAELSQNPRSFIWPVTGSPVRLDGNFGNVISFATGMNSAGEVTVTMVGFSGAIPGVWSELLGLRMIPLLPSGPAGSTSCINNAGVIGGTIDVLGIPKAVLWATATSTPVVLGDLPGVPTTAQSSVWAVTDGGTVYAIAQNAAIDFEVVTWSQATGYSVIPGLAAADPKGANNMGSIVGERFVPALGQSRGWMWDSVFGVQDLTSRLAPGSSSWTILSARAVNDSGQIVAVGRSGSRRAALVLTPAPDVPPCDTIDFNNDGVSPDSLDIDDLLAAFGGGACSNDPNCQDLDFNNDGVSPDTADIEAFLRVFGGGEC